MKTKMRHLSNYLISMEPDLLLAQPNPSQTYECPSMSEYECLRVVPTPRGGGKVNDANFTLSAVFFVDVFP